MDESREHDESPIRHFTDLEVWRKSHQIFLDLLRELEQLPQNRAAAIFTDQLLRSVGSIGANIAEGFNRSQAKFVNSLSIALGEANEAENWLYKLRDAGYLTHESLNEHIKECIQLEKMLASLHRKIRQR